MVEHEAEAIDVEGLENLKSYIVDVLEGEKGSGILQQSLKFSGRLDDKTKRFQYSPELKEYLIKCRPKVDTVTMQECRHFLKSHKAWVFLRSYRGKQS